MFFERENEALRGERERLTEALDQLEGQYAGLHRVASAIYARLDESIKRLSQMIEN